MLSGSEETIKYVGNSSEPSWLTPDCSDLTYVSPSCGDPALSPTEPWNSLQSKGLPAACQAGFLLFSCHLVTHLLSESVCLLPCPPTKIAGSPCFLAERAHPGESPMHQAHRRQSEVGSLNPGLGSPWGSWIAPVQGTREMKVSAEPATVLRTFPTKACSLTD